MHLAIAQQMIARVQQTAPVTLTRTINASKLSNIGYLLVRQRLHYTNNPFAPTANLEIGRIAEEPIATREQVVPDKNLALSRTCNHRIIDDTPAIRCLQPFADFVRIPYEQSWLMLYHREYQMKYFAVSI